MASLASKNPGLWKSKRSLARCGGEDFVAALIFMAAGHDSWSKTPKRALLLAFHGVATEAARALQRFWRGRQRQRRTAAVAATTAAVVGYTAKASTYHGSFGERRSVPAAPRGRSEPSADSNPTPAVPSGPKKSNPRPMQSRAVPVNPLQAMKLRHAQQQQEAEERRLHGMQEAEEARQARPRPAEVAGGQSQSLPEAVDENLIFTPPITAAQSTMEALLANLAPQRDGQEQDGTTADSTPKLDGKVDFQGDNMLTPLELRKLRAEASKTLPTEGSPVAQQGSAAPPDALRSIAATERLRDRLRQRESSNKTERTARPVTDAGASQVHWKERIELRHKEAQEQQVQEKEEKQRTAERSTKRADAMRRVLERREQRQQESIGLEED